MGASWSSAAASEASSAHRRRWIAEQRGSLAQQKQEEALGFVESPSETQPDAKRQKRTIEQVQLIPGLPDEIALQILARVPRSWHRMVRLVCSSWNEVMTSRVVYEIRRDLKLTEEWLYVLLKDKEDELCWHSLDPLTGEWRRLPDMPKVVEQESKDTSGSRRNWLGILGSSGVAISEVLRGFFWRKGANDRVPFFGCSAAQVDGCLLVLGGFTDSTATSRVWKYDPVSNCWSEAAAMCTPRAYCKTGVLGRKLYAVGGVTKGRNGLTPLQSAEVYDPEEGTWSPIAGMPFVGAQVLPTAFMTDILKPIATGMAAFRGQLWVPQSLYSWPFFMDVGGEVFDPCSGCWREMPKGMGEGWPARQAGMKLSVVVGGKLYSLDPAGSPDGSRIKVYDFNQDCWRVVVKKVPVLLDLTSDAESPYLLCGLDSGLHIVTKDGTNRVAVLRCPLASEQAQPSADVGEQCDWTTVAVKSFGRVELVACQVIEL